MLRRLGVPARVTSTESMWSFRRKQQILAMLVALHFLAASAISLISSSLQLLTMDIAPYSIRLSGRLLELLALAF
jgi:hypothetical protein